MAILSFDRAPVPEMLRARRHCPASARIAHLGVQEPSIWPHVAS